MSTYKFNMSQYRILLEEMLKEPSLKYLHRFHIIKEETFAQPPDNLMHEEDLEEGGATLESHASVIQEIRKIIHSGVFCSMLYVKKDGTLRPYNIHKEPMSAVEKLQGMPRYDPADYNILRIWDNNAVNPKTGDRGGWRSATVSGIIYFKKSPVVYDFTEVNADASKRIDPNILNTMVKQMGIFNGTPQIIKVR